MLQLTSQASPLTCVSRLRAELIRPQIRMEQDLTAIVLRPTQEVRRISPNHGSPAYKSVPHPDPVAAGDAIQ